MNILKGIWGWVVYSSQNPEKFSLTLKGFIPFLVLFNFGDAVSLGATVDTAVHFIVITATWLTGAIGTYGALRKIYASIPSLPGEE